MVFWQEQKYELAKECFERVISLDATSASAHLNLGNVYCQQQQLELAISAYQSALKIKPHYASAWHNLGLIYQSKKQLESAEIAFSRAIKEDKHSFTSYLELGKTWDFTNQTTKSKKLYQEALKRNPPQELQQQFVNLLKLAEIKLGEYHDYDLVHQNINQQLRQCIQSRSNHEQFNLFELLNLDIENELFLEIAKLKSQELTNNVTKIDFTYRQCNSHSKIRIGYVSPDFRDHAVGRLIHDVFRHHNREQFEVYGYYLIGIEGDICTEKIKQGCDVFRNLSDLSDQDAARQINRDGIDILIDLAGYTYGSNPAIFALQPAPVQISYLCYPGPIGADFIQYILADKWLIPDTHQNFYSDKVVYLPQGFIGSPTEVFDDSITKAKLGLPDSDFIFTCSNHYRKINPLVWQTWMEILQAVPDSVLWLKNCPIEVQKNFKQNAAKFDIASERLIFAPNIFLLLNILAP